MASPLRRFHPPSLLRFLSTASAARPSPPRDSQTLTLPSGRLLGYAEYGLPTGKPLLFFHGYPSCRLEGYALGPIGARLGLRILSLDRPGFGLSSPLPGRRIADYPADVRALAAHLGLQRFAVLGASGGGPYALACAAAMPPRMLTAVGLLASGGPWEAGKSVQSWWRKSLAFGIDWTPWLVRGLLGMTVVVVRRLVRTTFVTTRLDAWLASENEKLKEKQKQDGVSVQEGGEEAMTVSEEREQSLRVLLDGFAQGPAAAVQEGGLLAKPWGIQFEDIDYDKVQIWHGAEDKQSPVENIRWMAEKIPGAELKELEADGHFSMAEQIENVMKELGEEIRKKDEAAPKES